MATVYMAIEDGLQRKVAIKVLDPSLAVDPVFVERFNREARLLASLSHPNLIHVYSIGKTDDGLHYMAMEFLAGEPLDKRIRRTGPLPVDEVWRIAGQVLGALHALHKAGLVHRDVKPSNIMLCAEQRAVLMDFGLAKSATERGVTQEGIIAGTPEYMSPEQAKGEDLEPASDLYSLGATLFESLSGRVPYPGKSAISILRAHCDAPIPDLSSLRPELHPAASLIVRTTLSKTTEERFADAPEMASAMLKVSSTPELAELARRSRVSALPQTRIVGAVDRGPSRDEGSETLQALPEIPAPPKRRMRKVIIWVLVVFFGLLFLSAIVNGIKNRGTRKPATTPRYVTDQLGNKVIANPICSISLPGEAEPRIGRLESIDEDGKVTYFPLDSSEPVVITGELKVKVLSEQELRKLGVRGR